jgi:hypothetical protein
MMKAGFLFFGLGSSLFGLSSYLSLVTWPINCKRVICEIGTNAITVELAAIGLGILSMLISQMCFKAKARAKR